MIRGVSTLNSASMYMPALALGAVAPDLHFLRPQFVSNDQVVPTSRLRKH